MIEDSMLDRPTNTLFDEDEPALDEVTLAAFLSGLEPQVPPAGLVESIEALTSQPCPPAGDERPAPVSAWKETRWALQGPRVGLRSLRVPLYGSEQAWNGIATMRFALGPLLNERPTRRAKPKQSWWLRQAVRLWR